MTIREVNNSACQPHSTTNNACYIPPLDVNPIFFLFFRASAVFVAGPLAIPVRTTVEDFTLGAGSRRAASWGWRRGEVYCIHLVFGALGVSPTVITWEIEARAGAKLLACYWVCLWKMAPPCGARLCGCQWRWQGVISDVTVCGIFGGFLGPAHVLGLSVSSGAGSLAVLGGHRVPRCWVARGSASRPRHCGFLGCLWGSFVVLFLLLFLSLCLTGAVEF